MDLQPKQSLARAGHKEREHGSHPPSLAEPENEIFLLVFGHP